MPDSTTENFKIADNPQGPQDPAVQENSQPDQQELPLEMREHRENLEDMDAVDLASWMSFPASDPPSFSEPEQRPSAKGS